MLWYKAWRETRLKILMPVGMVLFVLFLTHHDGGLRRGAPLFLAMMAMFWPVFPLLLAGSGVTTDPPFRAVKGSDSSLYFTLSLPVSRSRLLGMRVAVGMTETAVLIGLTCGAAAIILPELRHYFSGWDALLYVFTVIFWCTSVYGLATLFSAFLDQQCQVLATMMVFWAGRGLAGGKGILFRALEADSPLVTHAFPWAPSALSLGLGLVCMVAAVKVVEARQY